QRLLLPVLDSRDGLTDLSRDEFLATQRRLVIEQNAAARINAVAFAVVDGDPMAVRLGDAIRAARPKRSSLRLRRFLHLAEHLAARRLIKADRRIDLPH